MRKLIPMTGAIAAVVIMTAALCLWQGAPQFTDAFDRPDVAVWAVRCAAVAIAALAQVIIATMVMIPMYRRDITTAIYGAGSGLVVVVALASATVLAMIGR